MSPVVKLLLATVGLLLVLKVVAVLRNRAVGRALPQGLGWLVYFLGWPGLRPESFAGREAGLAPVGPEFVEGFAFFVIGLSLQAGLSVFWNSISETAGLYAGLISFLLIVHFGVSSMLYAFYRICGWPVERLFLSPLLATSLQDFWSRRWNLAFVDMNKRLLRPLLPSRPSFAFLAIFVLSGLLHELAISFPANGGWGGPLFYFLIHGALARWEPRWSSRWLARLWVWAALLLPLPLLFHQPFLRTFIAPYFEFGHQLANIFAFKQWLYGALILCGFGHLLILVASFQVPGKLGWKTDFARLSRFNQKIFWTYGGYIVFCIVAFALMDVVNARDLIEPGSCALSIAAFIALFWTVRVIVDFGYFKHEDWPKGDQFVIGHICLTALFSTLALVHWALVAYQFTLPGLK